MSKRSYLRLERISLFALVCLALLLAACTRSANPTTLPTATVEVGDGLLGGDGQEATMAAIGTEVAAQLTQTAVAVSGVGGGEETSPPPTTEPGVVETATPVPDVVTQPTDTPVAPPVATTVAPPPAAGAACPAIYVVQPGDWIYKIARQCGVEPSAIIAANPGINPDRIEPGQQLVIPQAAVATPVPGAPAGPTCTGTYVVQRGDNLFRLAYNCGLTTEQLAALNNIPYPYIIYPGQVIRYP